MKTYLFTSILLLIFGLSANAQVDTVCNGTTGKSYSVTATSGSTYQWFITGGTQASGGNTNAITVNWGTTAGSYSIRVVETNSYGCVGDTVSLPVVVLEVPTATMSGMSNLCYSDGDGQISVAFTGLGPWEFTYTNGSQNFTVSNISTSPYNFYPATQSPIPAPGAAPITTTYSLVSVTGGKSCSGTVAGSATVTIYSKPVTSTITY